MGHGLHLVFMLKMMKLSLKKKNIIFDGKIQSNLNTLRKNPIFAQNCSSVSRYSKNAHN